MDTMSFGGVSMSLNTYNVGSGVSASYLNLPESWQKELGFFKELQTQEAEINNKLKGGKAAEQAEFDAKVKAAVESTVTVGQSGAERLLADIEKRFEEQTESTKSVLAGLEIALKDKTEELAAIQKSKMQFGDKSAEEVTYAEKEKAFFLSKMTGKSYNETKFGQSLIQKAGAHVPSATWELEVSTNLESEVRRRLVVAPIMRQIAMQTNVMKLPLNPEAGYADWVQNSQFGDSTYTGGSTQTHSLKEITLSAYKLATREYMNFEEEEDSLIVLLPFIRDSMVRRIARSIDKAYLQGAGSGSDPVTGLTKYSNTAATAVSVAVASGSPVTVANLRAMRAKLGVLGLDPAEVTFIVNSDVYYNLLEDTVFQTMNQVGPQATLLTGQIGTIGNSPVLVSGELPEKPVSGTAAVSSAWASDVNVGALAVYTPNFVIGNQRGLRMDTQELVESQRRVMVASLRTGFTRLSSTYGSGVVSLRYAS
jgi:HK97 family phage major capsid protein